MVTIKNLDNDLTERDLMQDAVHAWAEFTSNLYDQHVHALFIPHVNIATVSHDQRGALMYDPASTHICLGHISIFVQSINHRVR